LQTEETVLFHSLPFVGVFLPLTYLVYWRLRGRAHRYQWLAVAGCVFYAVLDYKFCALLVASMLLTYAAGVGLSIWQDPLRRRLCAAVPLAGGLFLLGFFKFAMVWLDTANSVANKFQLAIEVPHLSLMVPLGLSWYVAGMLIYIIETYTGRIQPTRNFWEFACQITFFPKLIAGPIARFWQTDADLKNLGQAEGNSSVRLGLSFFALGMIQKVLIADTLAGLIDPGLKHYGQLSTAGAWMCMLGYTYQFYFDCAGYFDMAVGLGHLFGIRLPQNFNSPYQAVDLRDFWRRWNITISAVLRDFIYFPLGGSRGSRSQTCRNLFITMLLCGIGHGPNWAFVAWGGYHGVLLAANYLGARQWDRLPRFLRQLGTFFLIVIGWVFFRSDDLPMAFALLRTMFSAHAGPTLPHTPSLLLILVTSAVIAHGLPDAGLLSHRWRLLPGLAIAGLFALCLVMIYGSQPSSYLICSF
jgi:alginate O-acetyltransferase complex protein AlgI